MRTFIKICISIAALIIWYIGGLYFMQDMFIYYPTKYHVLPEEANVPAFEEKTIAAADGTELRIWFAKGYDVKPAILFFHGNAWQNSAFAEQLQPFIDDGYTVLMMEYRGFGDAEGKLSQQAMYSDVVTTFDWLKDQGYEKIIVSGYSLGCAAAISLANQRNVDGLMLTAPFASLYELVGEKPVPLAQWALKDHYPSDELIKTVKTPTLVVHGKKDRLIPYQHGQKIYDASGAEDKQLFLLDESSHHSIYYKQENVPYLQTWLDEHFGAAIE